MPDLVLNVEYFPQWDSDGPEGYRQCFSSSNAMLLNYIKPNALVPTKDYQQKDDVYLYQHLELHAGRDTTNPQSQVATLRELGLNVVFTDTCTWDMVDNQLKKGIPVPIGTLHKGPVDAPYGGHWMVIVGRSGDGKYYIVHDPAGELDLVNGGYHISNDGKAMKYSKVNLSKRWLNPGNPASGWAILASK